MRKCVVVLDWSERDIDGSVIDGGRVAWNVGNVPLGIELDNDGDYFGDDEDEED